MRGNTVCIPKYNILQGQRRDSCEKIVELLTKSKIVGSYRYSAQRKRQKRYVIPLKSIISPLIFVHLFLELDFVNSSIF